MTVTESNVLGDAYSPSSNSGNRPQFELALNSLLWTPGNDDDESGVTQVVEAAVDQHPKLKVVVTKNCCYLQDII